MRVLGIRYATKNGIAGRKCMEYNLHLHVEIAQEQLIVFQTLYFYHVSFFGFGRLWGKGD